MADQKKSRKHGRNKDWCTVYRSRGRRERNKALKMLRHAARHSDDMQTMATISKLRRTGHEPAWRDAVRSYIAARDGRAFANADANFIDKMTA